ncbi:hypothetical protein Dimus_016839 [Dionaea muscipula]
MAARKAFSVEVDTNLRGFAILLKSAACEWVLLFFLLVDAAFSYFVTKFAQYCELQVPCILCSRLDHVFGKVKSDFYRDLLCSNHKDEISSLVSCQIHGMLGDAHGMCEECVLSFAMKKESNQEMCKFLVGKLGLDGVQNPLFKDFVPGSLGTKSCACCSKPWRCRPNVQKLFPSRTTVGHKVSKPDIPLPSPPRARSLNHRRDVFKKDRDRDRDRDRFSVSCTPLLLGFSGHDPLSHVGYTEVKITSDSESDFLFSDDDDSTTVLRDQNDLRDEFGAHAHHHHHHSSRFFSKKQFDDLFLIKQTHHQSINSGSDNNNNHNNNIPLDTDVDSDSSEKSGHKHHLGSLVGVGHGLGETHCKTNPPPLLPELISLDDIPLSSNLTEVNLSSVPADDDDDANNFPFSNQFSTTYGPAEVVSRDDPLSSQKSADVTGNDGTGHKKIWEAFDSASTKIGPGFCETGILQSGHFDANEFESKEASGMGSEDLDGHGLAIANKENMVTSLPLPSTSQGGPDIPSSNRNNNNNNNNSFMNGHGHGHGDESQVINDAAALSFSNGFHKLQSCSVSMERSPSYESLDGIGSRSSVSDVDGESLVDRLRRQIEYDKKRINNLQEELEAERNASEIAANEAMAMITKLQEEKAALHMDALQQLRMMEEQAEYDVDALEKANDLLAEKEKEIQDLEAELEFYKLRYPEEEEEQLDLELEEDTVNQAWALIGDNIKLEAITNLHHSTL